MCLAEASWVEQSLPLFSHVFKPNSDSPRRGKGFSKLCRQLAGFEIDNETFSRVDGQRELALGYSQRFARAHYHVPKFFCCCNHIHSSRSGRF
jgi:hypothetical protein